jgi:hypothetical protein
MNPRLLGGLTAALFSAGLTLGAGLAAAQPNDYTALIIDPNVVTDSQAYTAGTPTLNPGGQPGATTVFTHRDGGRTITDTVWVLADPAAASSAINQAQGSTPIANQKLASAAVGSGGQLITGTSPDGSQSLSVLYFTEGSAASSIQFAGPAADPAPSDLVIEMGQEQDALIKSQLGT